MESFKSKGKGEIGAKTGYREIPPTSSGADRIDFLGGKNMRVLLVKPGEVPCIVEMDNTLEVLQDAVGGFIEAVYPFDDPIALICNENGKLDDLPLNRALRDEDGCIYDVIAGSFLVTGLGEEDFSSLTPELLEKYQKRFLHPEQFFEFAGRIVVLPQDLS